ncbi:putative RDD family membrane protein YckC [Larkinella arboricola]|uniref:Putative RDD family membrane protein YckC n=2 Tax=Larkinella arboricola TaxID=643671 RepID=A0A327X7D7_LARAB|nr:putative RDD family membrane protein YckC [Larkinella arboricola]
MTVSILTSQNVALEYEPASLGDRILALMLDYLIFLGWIIFYFVLTSLMPGVFQNRFASMAVLLLPFMLYDLLCEVFLNGQSLGKIAMKIRVVMLDGSPPGLGAYLIRWLFRLIESPLFFTGIVPLVTVAANGRGQRIGDIAAGTTVVKLTRPVTLAQVTYHALPEDYQVSFPEVAQLSDRDMNTIREALRSNNYQIIGLAAHKVKQVIGVQSELHDVMFLRTLISDYQFLAS